MRHLYSKKDWLIGFLLSLIIIVVSVLIVTYIPILYHLNIQNYDINTSLPATKIIEAYDSIIYYLSVIGPSQLVVPHFTLTQNALTHFEDVKVVFMVFHGYVLIGGGLLIYLIRHSENKMYTKTTVIWTLFIVGVISLFAFMDFDQAFVLMHKIVFRNDYWLMSPTVDPVINIFPETYFYHLFIEIIVLVGLGNLFVYRRNKQ